MFMFFYHLSRKVPGFYKILRLFYGCDIPLEATIGSNVKFNHSALGTVIHPNSIIEDNVWIEHHVLLGQRTGDNTNAPLIKKDCVIGAYAILLGGITVGEGSVIGAGTIVTHDIPPYSIVYNEQKMVIKENYKPRGKY